MWNDRPIELDNHMHQQQFTVTNIKCSACSKMINLLLMKMNGVMQVLTDESSGLVKVTAEQPVALEHIREKLAEKGYQVREA